MEKNNKKSKKSNSLPLSEENVKTKELKIKKSRSKKSLEENGLLDEISHHDYLNDKIHPYADIKNKEQK